MNMKKIFILILMITINAIYAQIDVKKFDEIDNSDLINLFAFSGIKYAKFKLNNIDGNISIKLYEVYDNTTLNSEFIIEKHKISTSKHLDFFLMAKIDNHTIDTSFIFDNKKTRNTYYIGQSDTSEFSLEEFDEFKSKKKHYIVLTYQPQLEKLMPFGIFNIKPNDNKSLEKLIKNSEMRFYIYEITINK